MTCILVIEDDPAIRENIAETLEYEGYDVLQADNGSTGVECALRAFPDLILCDVMMPKLDGYGVLAALRSEPSTSTIPFIFLTAKAEWQAVRKGMDLGADDYLAKPHTMPELLAAVHTRLEKRHSIERIHQQSVEALNRNLIRMLPHELRTPLNAILGNAQLMRSDYERLNKQDVQQMGEEIFAASERLQHVIENYFLYAQTELLQRDATRMKIIAEQRVEMPGVLIREVVSAKARQYRRENDIMVQTDNIEICMMAESLWKIVEELVDNALKFSLSGSEIQIIGHSERGTYLLQVRDQGRGMTPDQLKQVGLNVQFERDLYEQQGVGLGLVLAQQLTQLYGGALKIVSEPGGGTTVSVDLMRPR